MADRALIIAIWKYAGVQGLAPVSLDAVPSGAEKFYNWLTDTRKIPPENILVCSDGLQALPNHPASTMSDGTTIPLLYGSTFSDINQAIANLVSFAPDRTSDFFVYCAGHGFSYSGNPNEQGVSFLLTSEFVAPGASGNACINLPLLQRNLASTLSGLHHFHFVDACRNELSAKVINPQGGLGVLFHDSKNRSAPLFNLYSASLGDAAAAGPEFTKALVDGLNGVDHGKQWVDGELWVTFNRVILYATAALNRSLASEAGDRDDKIKLMPRPWTQNCRVVVKPNPAGPYKLTVSQAGGLSQSFDVATTPYTISLSPNDNPYVFTLTKDDQPLYLISPLGNIDMYSSCEVVFSREAPSASVEPPPSVPPAMARINVNPNFLQLTGRAPKRRFSIDGVQLHSDREIVRGIELVPGRHRVSLIEDGHSVWHHPLDLAPGSSQELLVGNLAATKFQFDLLRTIGQEHYRTPDLSETLGPTADWDVSLWLMYLGVAHLRQQEGFYLKLQTVLNKLIPAAALFSDAAGLFVLIMDEDGEPSVGLHRGNDVGWLTPQSVPNQTSLYAYSSVCRSGPSYLSIGRQKGEPFTYSTTFTKGQFTLITVAAGKEVRMQQITVPTTGTNTATNDKWAHPGLSDLQTTRILSYAQSEFLYRRPVWKAGFAELAIWDDLQTGKWRNEQLATLCAFDCKRRGRQEDLQRFFNEYASSSTDAFASDFAALQSTNDLKAPPLLVEAYLLAGGLKKRDPFPVGRLDFRGLWVSWYGAVNSPGSDGN